MPHFHLTNPCFRDLKKHVKKSEGWDLKRIECTAAQKRDQRIFKNSRAYFVNAIYKVPGTLKKKKTKKATKSSASSSTSEKKSHAPASKKRAATAPTKKKVYKTNPEATAALQAVLESAQDDPNGAVNAGFLKNALAFGYSQAFIDAKIVEQEELAVKPAAKRTKNSYILP
jgi:hypothetical protein